MINIFDILNTKTRDLKHSLDVSGFKNETIVLEDDGFLDDDMTSPIAFFTGMYDSKYHSQRPRFFNEITVPNYWQIAGSNEDANIFDGYKKRGYIRFHDENGYFRAIQEVEWFNDIEKVRQIDLYNKYGNLFGKKSYSDGKLTLSTYFNEDMQEVILINHVANTVQVNYQGKNHLFNSRIDFIEFYLSCNNFNLDRIFFNSLSTSYFVAARMAGKTPQNKTNILFWQETSETMPGNMRSIFDRNDLNMEVMVQDFNEYSRLRKQIDNGHKLNYLGFIYEYNHDVNLNKEAFILTRSDNVEQLAAVVTELTDWTIHVAAYTEMSDKLMRFGQRENVKLYPNIDDELVDELALKASVYLDINHAGEAGNIIRKVFDNNKLILAFEDTKHSEVFIDSKNIIKAENAEQLIDRIRETTASQETYTAALEEQRLTSGQSSIDEYERNLA